VTDRKLILFAYHFPPDTVIGGARPYRFYKYLKRLGYQVHVITASPQTGSQNEGVEYVPDPFLSARQGSGWQVERAVRKFLLPGVLGMRWAHAACSAAQRALSKGTNACILSTCPPLGTHYAAWRLARAERLPWIADFRDPFGGVSLEMGGLNAFQKRLFNWLEKKVIETADLVIANTDSMADQWIRQHPRQAAKIHLLWNGFDPESPIPALPLPDRTYKVLSHVGELYAGRTVTPVLKSIGRLVDRHQLSAKAIRVSVIGPAKASAIPDEPFIEWGRAQGWLDLSTESVSQKTARQISQTSDSLLLVQPQSDVQVPGKLYEYLQIGRPILAFVMPNSPVERILAQSGVPYRCVYTNSSPNEMDRTILEFFTLSSDAVTASEWFQQNFHAEHQAQTLKALMESVTKRKLISAQYFS
jgi:glycosyltransferase involved in cell wall biosynthesis